MRPSFGIVVAIIFATITVTPAFAQELAVHLGEGSDGSYCVGGTSIPYSISNDTPWEGLVLCHPQLKSGQGSWTDLIELDGEGVAKPPFKADLLLARNSIGTHLTDGWLDHFGVEGSIRIRCLFADVAIDDADRRGSTIDRAETARTIVMTTPLEELTRAAAVRTSETIDVHTVCEPAETAR
jgi:hypothetical protein